MKEPRLVIGSRRRCDNDGRFYTVKTETHRFCRDACRKAFHRYGSPFLQLRTCIQREVELAADAIEFRLFAALDGGAQARYRQANPKRAGRFDEQLEEVETGQGRKSA